MTCRLALSPVCVAEHSPWCFILAGHQVVVRQQGGQVTAVPGQGQGVTVAPVRLGQVVTVGPVLQGQVASVGPAPLVQEQVAAVGQQLAVVLALLGWLAGQIRAVGLDQVGLDQARLDQGLVCPPS